MFRQSIIPARVNPVLSHPAERRASLSGAWCFRLDPDDRGVSERWFQDDGMFRDEIAVPGCWQGQGFGGDDKEMIWDFRLWARTFRATYTGTGWYSRRFRVPNEWREARLWLLFGGVHPTAEVWLNGVRVGEHHEPFVPFGFDIIDLVDPGGENVVVVRVCEDDRILGLAYSWQGNWSGLYRGVELVGTGSHFLERFSIIPGPQGERLRLRVRVGGKEPSAGSLTLRVSAQAVTHEQSVHVMETQVPHGDSECEVPIPSPALWSPDAPNLYRVDAELLRDGEVLDALSERTGFVTLSTSGKHFLINGEPFYLRGTGEFIPFPETGSPDTDRERLRKKLLILQDYGYNYARCQSYAPVPEYYDVADEVGLIAQAEMGMLGAWGSHTQEHIYAWPQPTAIHRDRLKRQWDHIVLRDVSHPSAIMYCMSNELGKSTSFPRVAWECYHDTKATKPNAFVIWTDGGYSPDLPGDFVNAEADTDRETDKPLIQHEFRWWSSFPDVRIMDKYSGAVRPYAAELALEAAARHGIVHALPQAAQNSQRLQFIEAKGKMEAMRRDHPHLAGICHFNAMDTNPSPQGIIDEFFERKYADAATWRETNGDTVILSSLGFHDRILAGGDSLRCDLFVSDFSHPPLVNPAVTWRLTVDVGERERAPLLIADGRLTFAHEPHVTTKVGSLDVRILRTPELETPVRAHLEAVLSEGARRFGNRWDLWLFPKTVPLPKAVGIYGAPEHTWLRGVAGPHTVPQGGPIPDRFRVMLSERLDDALVEFMRRGGCVVLAASEGLVRPFGPKLGLSVGRYFFTPPANYPPYEDGHDGTIILDHPMLGEFPHEGFADLHFYRLMGEAPPLELESLGLSDADPVIRAMHSYPVGRSLGYLVERRFGKGGIIVTALDLDQSLPEARYLLGALCAHAGGDAFAPGRELGDPALAAIRSGTMIR